MAARMTPSDRATLLARVEVLQGADREVDAAIGKMFGNEIPWRDLDFMLKAKFTACSEHTAFIGSTNTYYLPFYTSSLDAVIALVERCFSERKGLFWSIGKNDVGECDADLGLGGSDYWVAQHKTP